ncbi:MAG: hypothetical protein LBE91_12285 [Tannerella sp.]|jgi:hypothetical protein|nr:hypothetical protein [Tannerella sp.]
MKIFSLSVLLLFISTCFNSKAQVIETRSYPGDTVILSRDTIILPHISMFDRYAAPVNADSLEAYKEKVRTDIKNNTKKYYYFGMLPPSKEFQERMALHNIDVKTMNCLADFYSIAYNELILNSLE